MAKSMSRVEEQIAKLNPQQHELDWSCCSACGKEVPNVTLDTTKLKGGEHVCRFCTYGPTLAEVARQTNMATILAAVLRYRYERGEMRGRARYASTHASRTAIDN